MTETNSEKVLLHISEEKLDQISKKLGIDTTQKHENVDDELEIAQPIIKAMYLNVLRDTSFDLQEDQNLDENFTSDNQQIQLYQNYFRLQLPGQFCNFKNPKSFKELRFAQNKDFVYDMLNLGVRLAKEGKFFEALQLYNEALKISKNHIKVLLARGALYAKVLGSLKKASYDFKLILDLKPNFKLAQFYLNCIEKCFQLENQSFNGPKETTLKDLLDTFNLDPNVEMDETNWKTSPTPKFEVFQTQ